ncbi:mutt nudix family protein [Seminavis robusta]|uniref:Mutt nudix family protein n=1 Tax=Seminavis robusta TaxID=568900 RepID=A0A9N8H3C8_9STRA|nr:mutt nudix family protein [Seminavis robusta]|eukprot:Sro84_g045060.1 mutt nudix family protein (159) ;mRNA; r:112014-112490
MTTSTNSLKEKDLYFVAVKGLLRKGDELLLTKDIFKDGWDIPGGRLKPHEFETPLADVLERKIREELGPEVQYMMGEAKVFFRHERTEPDAGHVRIFAVGFECQFLQGSIQLGEHHEQYDWVNVKAFDPKERFTGGWCKGLEEYVALVKQQDQSSESA